MRRLAAAVLCLVAATSALSLVRCGSRNVDSTRDPKGTITTRMLYVGAWLIDFETGTLADCCTFDPDMDVHLAGANWQCAVGLASAAIAHLGPLSGLGGISKAPGSGFIQSVAVEVAHGYVVRTNKGKHARVYVVDWTCTDGETTGVEIKWTLDEDGDGIF